jgi:hypothetical protein
VNDSGRRSRRGSERFGDTRSLGDRTSVIVSFFGDSVRSRIGNLERDVFEVGAREKLGLEFDVTCRQVTVEYSIRGCEWVCEGLEE